MITVLQVIPHLGAGGAEQACVDVAAGLTAAHNRALVVSAGGPRVEEIEYAGGEHILRPVHNKDPASIIVNARSLARLIREKKVDIIHARSRGPAWSAYLASRMTGCPLVTTVHAAYHFSNPLKKFYNSVMMRGDRVIAISNFIATQIRTDYQVDQAKIRIIPRGIDFEQFMPEKITLARQDNLRRAWQAEPGQPIILMPSRLSPIKGQSVFIEALALAIAPIKAIAVIIGDDQGRHRYRSELMRLIIDRKLQDRVRLAPHCSDMPAACSLASLVVVPSLVPEGFGRVPVEAMAMGVPVIASDLGGLSETVRQGETGWLVPPNSPADLAFAIDQAMALTPEQRTTLAHKAIREARTHYDKHKMVEDTLAVYEELMKGRTG